ncbi:MAG: hypothetical protein EOO40_01665 [Deltaproteobacteria bacterium]|nr:MAG: hypothetical protein EOO40_01665 [Deltaproteobacteria bacterium]
MWMEARISGETVAVIMINGLLDADHYRCLLHQPSLVKEQTSPDTIIVIDEIQKLPGLLDEVHRLIEKWRQKLSLTGSSARKLRRGAAQRLSGVGAHADRRHEKDGRGHHTK